MSTKLSYSASSAHQLNLVGENSDDSKIIMDNPKTEETTHSDATEPIVSWSGVQGETQGENVEVPNADELHITKPEDKDSDADQQMKEKE